MCYEFHVILCFLALVLCFFFPFQFIPIRLNLSGSFKNTTFDQVSLKQMRPPVILLSALSVLLIFLTAYFSFGTVVGLFSALIYALMPIVVVSSRMVTAENYLTPFLLLFISFSFL